MSQLTGIDDDSNETAATPTVAWDRVAELNTVRALGDLVRRRWRLPLALVGRDGHVTSVGADGGDGRSRLAARRRPGPSDVAAPIELDGAPLGWVVAPGFGGGVDQRFLADLVETAAAEIVAFHSVSPWANPSRVGGSSADGADDGPLVTRYDYSEIVGQSGPMRRLFRLLDKVTDADSTVLIEGENGTGKELIARAIHYNSPRKRQPFVVQNCSAFNDNLLDSELFGHRKGAFTGAVADKLGLFSVADGGTFFLDEIGDMSPSLQVKLLRVLQEGTFTPVGDTRAKRVDVRIIAATNRNLRELMDQGSFREDLFYRVNVINITPPPLRERQTDVVALVDHFLAKQAKLRGGAPKALSGECLRLMLRYSWPGNVRELENEIERLVVLAGDVETIGLDLLSARIGRDAAMQPDGARPVSCLPEAMTNLERNMIYEVLQRNQWNKTRAAKELQISRRNLIRKVQKYKLEQ